MSAQNKALPKHLKTTNKHFSWVLATAMEMVEESIYQCQTFANTLEAHHNAEAADVFKRALLELEAELKLIETAKGTIQLPVIPPWEVPHLEYKHPAPSLMNTHYLSTSAEAWHTLDQLLRVHSCFYEHVLETTHQQESKQLIQQLQAHCRVLHQDFKHAISKADKTLKTDDDPPNTQG